MSQVYSTEPTPTGRVTIHTTLGPIDMSLYCKECPMTTRSFLQLCLDGYYDNLPFHRIMESFLIQTGQRSSSSSSSSLLLADINNDKINLLPPALTTDRHRDRLEINPRMRFNHRGQVAMARRVLEKKTDSSDDDHDDHPPLYGEFFITLDEAPWLDGKHVIFGTVSGPTIFNVLRIGRLEVAEGTDRPLDERAVVIKKVTLGEEMYFGDLVMSEMVPWKKVMEETTTTEGGVKKKKKKKKKRVGKRDLNVLGFGGEEEEMEDNPDDDDNNTNGMKSSHDVVAEESGSFLAKGVDQTVAAAAAAAVTTKKESIVSTATTDDATLRDGSGSKATDDNGDAAPDCATTPSSNPSKKTDNDETKDGGIVKNDHHRPSSSSSNNTPQQQPMTASSSLTIHKKQQHPPSSSSPTTAIEKPTMSALESRRAKYLSQTRKRSRQQSQKNIMETNILDQLSAFRTKVLKAKDNKKTTTTSQPTTTTTTEEAETYHGQILEGKDDDDAKGDDWLQTDFRWKQHMDTQLSSRSGGDGRRTDDYVTIDDTKGRTKGKDGRRMEYGGGDWEERRRYGGGGGDGDGGRPRDGGRRRDGDGYKRQRDRDGTRQTSSSSRSSRRRY